MLEAVLRAPRFTISLKRSTLNLQLSTSTSADYPIFVPKADVQTVVRHPGIPSPERPLL
jgi:hypothetical protein